MQQVLGHLTVERNSYMEDKKATITHGKAGSNQQTETETVKGNQTGTLQRQPELQY